MLNYFEMDRRFDELTTAQADRLLKSGMNSREFLSSPEEKAVAAEIDRLNKVLTEMDAASLK